MISIINAKIVNEGRIFSGSLKINGDTLAEVAAEGTPFTPEGEIIDAQGAYVMPGVIDEHVHFREPGLTHKADMLSETTAAAAGGVTTFFDMPNTSPQTTSLQALADKYKLAAQNSRVNYAFYIGATNDNAAELEAVNPDDVPAVKLFMGASTGNMLVEKDLALDQVFAIATAKRLPVVTHCEDSEMIAENEAEARAEEGDNAPVECHAYIRNEFVCLCSTLKAIALAQKHNASLLVAHISTKSELEAIEAAGDNIQAEGCVQYLYYNLDDYAKLGGRIKCNPAIKTRDDQQALRQALTNGQLLTIATDHAPHLLADKQGGVFQATSGMPGLQFSLVLMLQLADKGVLPIEQVAQLMSHNPAQYFKVCNRGFLRPGYKADLVMVKRTENAHTIADADVLSKCGWTPYAGQKTNWQVEATYCNGMKIYQHGEGITAPDFRGEKVEFKHAHNS